MKAIILLMIFSVATLALASYSVQDSQTRYAKIAAKHK